MSNNSLFEKLFGKKIKCFHCSCLSSGTAVAKHSKPYCKQRSILILSLSRCQQTRIGCFCSSFRLRLFFFPGSAVKGDKRIGLEAIDKSTGGGIAAGSPILQCERRSKRMIPFEKGGLPGQNCCLFNIPSFGKLLLHLIARLFYFFRCLRRQVCAEA